MDNHNTYNDKFKTCTKCKESKPSNHEHYRANGKTLRSVCKECEKQYRKEYYIKNKDKFLVASKKSNEPKKLKEEKERSLALDEIKLTGNWKVIKGHEDYLISDEGEVYSIKSKKIMETTLRKDGRVGITLWVERKGFFHYVHRLVLSHFCNSGQKETVNHKDGIPSNNHINNLEWMTQSENMQHAYDNGLRGSQKNNPKTSIPVNQIDSGGNVIKVYPSMSQAERETGVSPTCIRLGIENGNIYGGFNWSLVKR